MEEVPSYAISVRAEHRSESRANGQVDHDLRKGPIPKYVDRDRIKLNTVIIKPKTGPELRQICEARRNGREGGTKRRMKQNAAVSTNLLISFGKAAQPIFAALSVEDQGARQGPARGRHPGRPCCQARSQEGTDRGRDEAPGNLQAQA